MPRGDRTPRKKGRLSARFLLAVGAVMVLGAILSYIDAARLKKFMSIDYVRVEGEMWHLDADEFRTALMPHARQGYFSADLESIEAAARDFAWVDEVQAARVWPDTIVVRIREHQPVARWGEDSLLNDRGERFAPRDAASLEYLPLLSGPPGQEKQVLSMMRSLNAKLQIRRQRVETLRLSKRLAWVAQLDGGMEVVFGNQDPLSAMDRLLALLPQLGEERIAAIRKLDLRYPNGFSVVWKPEFQMPPESLSRIREPMPRDSGSA
jgi:cell division protein FtsQ